MIFGTYGYIKQQVARCQFYLDENVRRQRAPRVNSAAGRCAIAYCAKLYRVPARRENVAYIEPDMFPKQLGFKSGGLRHLEAMHE